MEDGYLALTKKMRLVLLPALFCAAWPAAGASAACSLQLLNSVPMEIKNNVMTVEADANGKTRSFQFGSAAAANQMTDASARALGLTIHTPDFGGPQVNGSLGADPSEMAGGNEHSMSDQFGGSFGLPTQGGHMASSAASGVRAIYDPNGNAYTTVATVGELDLQVMQTKNVDFFITPFPAEGVAGVLNLDMFGRYDIDLNFAERSFNTFSQDHCPGQILYWRAPGVAALPFLSKDSRIVTHVMLEGKELTAVIDTGSSFSALRFDASSRLFGITPNSAGLTLVGDHHADTRQDLYAYNFKTLSFGKVAIGNPHLMLTRGALLQGTEPTKVTGSLIINRTLKDEPDMVIGTDLLKLMHVYIALGERVLYVTQGPELAPDAAGAQPVVPVTPYRP